MTTLSITSERGKRYIERYEKSTMTSIMDAYKKPSAKKRSIFATITRIVEDCGGTGLKIICYNQNTFTVAFKRHDGFLQVITQCNNFIIK